MNSEEFFKTDSKFKNKTGIYVLKSPMKYKGNDIFKIGYAYISLHKRIRDYKTAYGPVEFNIFCVYEIPQRILNAPRTMFALENEKLLHETLVDYGVMKSVDDENKLEGEWFYDIDVVLNVIRKLRQKHLDEITNADKWDFYLYGGMTHIKTRSKSELRLGVIPDVKLVEKTSSKSTFDKLQVKPRTTRDKAKKKDNDFEYGNNKSRNFQKDEYVYKTK